MAAGMTEQERLTAFKAAVEAAGVEYGVRLAAVSQIGQVVLVEPTLGFVVLPELEPPTETPTADPPGE